MSATLGTLLKELTPEKDIQLFERLSQPAKKVQMFGIMRNRSFSIV